MKTGVNTWSYALAEIFRKHLNVIFTIIISLVLIAVQSFHFFVATLVVLVFIFFWIRHFAPKASYRRGKTKEVSIETDRNVVRQVMSKFEILQSNKYNAEIGRYIELINENLGFRHKEKFRQTIGYDGSIFLVNILRAVIIAIIGYGVFLSTSTISDFVLVAGLTGLLISTIGDFSNIGKSIADNMIHIEKLWKVFDDFTIDQSLDEGNEFVLSKGNIVFENVSFSYHGGRKVLSDFSLHIE